MTPSPVPNSPAAAAATKWKSLRMLLVHCLGKIWGWLRLLPRVPRLFYDMVAIHMGARGVVAFAIAAVAVALAFWPSARQDILVDVRTGLFQFTTPVGEGVGVSHLLLDELPLERIAISGGARWEVNARGAALGGASLILERADRSTPSDPDAAVGTEPDDHRDGFLGGVRSIELPPGAEVALRLTDSHLTLTVTPPSPAATPLRYGLTISTGDAWRVQTSDGDTLAGPYTGPEVVTVTGGDGQPLECIGRLDERLLTRVALGASGIRTTGFTLSEPVAPSSDHGISRLLGGTVTFSELPRKETQNLWVGERIDGRDFRGMILSIGYVPAAAPKADADPVDPHLRVVWKGDVSGLHLGYPKNLRDVRPSKLESFMASRGSVDYVALIAALVAFAALFTNATRDAKAKPGGSPPPDPDPAQPRKSQ